MSKKNKYGWLVEGQEFYFYGLSKPPQEEPEPPVLCVVKGVDIRGEIDFYQIDGVTRTYCSTILSEFLLMIDMDIIRPKTF